MQHPLVDSHPAERTPARQDTSPAEAILWLQDPQPPAPALELHDEIAREIAEAIGWPLEHVQEAVTELNEYDPEKRKCPVSRPTKS